MEFRDQKQGFIAGIMGKKGVESVEHICSHHDKTGKCGVATEKTSKKENRNRTLWSRDDAFYCLTTPSSCNCKQGRKKEG